MRIAVVGSRNATGLTMEKLASHIPPECTQIISGGAAGVDTLAEQYALRSGIDFLKIEPNYAFFGRQAPIVRDTKIVESADKVLAFWDYKSRGTAFTISECIRLQVPVQIISIKDDSG